MNRLLPSLFLGLLFAAAPALHAQVVVEKKRIPVSVVPFTGPGGEEAARVVVADLNRTLLIDAKAGAGENYTVSAVLADGALNGKLSSGSSVVLAKAYSGDARKAAHLFSDEIIQAVANVKGFSTDRIACVSSANGHKEIYTADIDGANALQVTNDRVISARPKWNAGGTKIAYTSYLDGYPDAYVLSLGASIKRSHVAAFPGINTGPAFSPDGSRLALTLSKDGNPLIYTMPAAGGNATRVTHTEPFPHAETSACWSPDGSKIVYNSDERGSVQLFVVPASGGAGTRLASPSTYSAEPDWSPDGSKIAFTGRSGGRFQIGVYDLSSGSATLVTKDGGEDPSWTTNSRHLVYAKGGALWILDTVTGQTAPLDNGLTQVAEPAVSR